MKTHKTFISMACLLTLAACGGGGGSSGPGSNSDNRQEMQMSDGKYKAIIRPLNHTLSGWIPNGMLDITLQGDNLDIKSWMDDSANVVHMQSIHMGTKCPDMKDDANKDGFVDFKEAMRVSKKVLMPLDSDLSSQAGGATMFPRGNYAYAQRTLLSSVMNDLSAADLDASDYMAKLGPKAHLNLEGKVVIVLGVVANRTLPASISTVNGQSPQYSIPIACGVIEKMPDVVTN